MNELISRVNVQFAINENRSKVEFIVVSEDGQELSAQECLDAVAEVILYEFGQLPVYKKSTMNS